MLKKTDGIILRFMESVSYDSLSKLSFYALLIWILNPAIVMLLNAFYANTYFVYTFWAFLLYISGGMGLLLSFIYFYKKIKETCTEKMQVIISMLPLIVIALFFIWCIVSTAFCQEKIMAIYGYYTLKDNLFTYLFYGGIMLNGLIVALDINLLNRLSYIYMAISFAMAFIAIINNSFTRLVSINDMTNCLEYESIYMNTNHFGYYLTIAVLTSAFLFIFSHKKVLKILWIGEFAFLTEVLILNDTFGSFLAIFLTLLFLVIWGIINNEIMVKQFIIVLFIFFISSLASLMFTNNIVINISSLFGDLDLLGNYGFVENEEISLIGTGRGELWLNALNMIKDHPIVGIGPQNTFFSAHNVFLQIAVYVGIPGLILYLLFLIVGVIRLFKARKDLNVLQFSAAFIVIGYLISAFFGITAFYIAPYYYLVLGVCLSGCLRPLINTN